MGNHYEWKIPEKKTVLFMGASGITRGIDDRRLENAMNISSPSERYPFTYLKLKKILSNKNNKIEHIILSCVPSDLSIVADNKIFSTDNEMVQYIPLYYLYFGREEWEMYNDYLLDIAEIVFSHSFRNWAFSSEKYFSRYGGFHPLNDVFDKTKMIAKKIDSIYYGSKINLSYFEKIISLCKVNNIRLTLLYPPMYKPELFYDQEYYYRILKTNFGDCEFLDYSHLSIPDEYRYDAHHLNGQGAKYFTKILVEELGLNLKNDENKTN
jgi:hypothetical protein